MSFLDRLMGRPQESAVKHSYPSDYYGFQRVPWNMGLGEFFDEGRGKTQWNTVAAVWAAVRLLSVDLASLPLHVYRKQPGGRVVDDEHHLYETLHDFVNPEMSSFQWREIQMAHLLTWGNCYSEKVIDPAGRLQLYPLRPDRMEVKWDAQGRRAYWFSSPDGKPKLMRPGSVFHVAGLSWDGLVGYSPITLARRTIAISGRLGDHADTFWSGGGRPGVVLTVPAGFPPMAKENLRAGWDEFRREKAGGTALLEDGVTATPWSMPHDDAQFIGTWNYQVSEVARWFGLPPHKLGDLEHATFSNIEHQGLEYVIHSLRPWLVRWEQAIKLQLLRDDPQHFVKFNMDALLRGDAVSQATALNIQLRSGAITPDEWRGLMERNAYPDGIGDKPFVSADMVPMEVALAPPPEPITEPPSPLDQPVLAMNGTRPAEVMTP